MKILIVVVCLGVASVSLADDLEVRTAWIQAVKTQGRPYVTEHREKKVKGWNRSCDCPPECPCGCQQGGPCTCGKIMLPPVVPRYYYLD